MFATWLLLNVVNEAVLYHHRKDFIFTNSVFLVTWTYLKFVASCSNLRRNIQNEQTLKVGESTENQINVKSPRVLERNVGPNHCDDTALILDPGDKVLISQRMNTEFSLISWCEQDLFRTI